MPSEMSAPMTSDPSAAARAMEMVESPVPQATSRMRCGVPSTMAFRAWRRHSLSTFIDIRWLSLS